MSDHVFYTKGSKGNHRKIAISNIVCLLSKAKEKRIKLKVTMSLSGQKMVGTPEWISAAHTFVAQNHDDVTPSVDFRGFDIALSTENLFGEKGVMASKCQMKTFLVSERGDEDDKEVYLSFVVYTPFSTSLWEWLGQMIGDDVWAKFTQVESLDDELELTGEDDEEEEELEDDE